jgi:hypothetical protein
MSSDIERKKTQAIFLTKHLNLLAKQLHEIDKEIDMLEELNEENISKEIYYIKKFDTLVEITFTRYNTTGHITADILNYDSIG